MIGRSIGATHAAASNDRSGNVAAEFIGQEFRDPPRVLKALAGELADGLEMEAVLQAGVPVAVLLALVAAFGDLVDAVALSAELDRPVDHADHAEIVEI